MLSEERPAGLTPEGAKRIVDVLEAYVLKHPGREDKATIMIAEWDLDTAARVVVHRLKGGHKKWCDQDHGAGLVVMYLDELDGEAPIFGPNSPHRHYVLAGKRLRGALRNRDPDGVGEVLSYIKRFYEFAKGYVDKAGHEAETRELSKEHVSHGIHE